MHLGLLEKHLMGRESISCVTVFSPLLYMENLIDKYVYLCLTIYNLLNQLIVAKYKRVVDFQFFLLWRNCYAR